MERDGSGVSALLGLDVVPSQVGDAAGGWAADGGVSALRAFGTVAAYMLIAASVAATTFMQRDVTA